MNVELGFQLKDLRGVVVRRAPMIGAVAGIVFLASIVLAGWLPNQYEAYTTLLIEPQSVSKKLVETGVESGDLNNRIHLMTMQILSRPRLSKIIDDLNLYPEESEEMTREEVIELMRDHIRVEPVLPELEQGQLRRTRDIEINTFRLYYRSEKATTAAAVANRLANDFIEEHIKERVQVSGDTSDFIESELTRLATRIQEVEAQIARVKAENPGRLPEDLDANQRLLERSIDSLRVVQRDLDEARSDEAFYRQQALTARAAAAPNDDASPERRLELLELALSQFSAKGYTEKHPDVVQAKQEIAELRGKLTRRAPREERDGGPTSLVRQNAEAEQRRAALRMAASQEDIARISKEIDDITARITDTPRVQERLSALEREYKHLFGSFQDFSNKRLEAGVAANMERRQKGEQFRVLESAFPPPEPASPNRILILALGAMLGLALGGGLGIVTESSDSSFHGARELQAMLRVPVLASIPQVLLESDRRQIRRRRARIGLATAGLVGLVLTSAAAGYVVVNGGAGWLLSGDEAEAPATAPPPAAAPAASPATPVVPGLAPPAPGADAAGGGQG